MSLFIRHCQEINLSVSLPPPTYVFKFSGFACQAPWRQARQITLPIVSEATVRKQHKFTQGRNGSWLTHQAASTQITGRQSTKDVPLSGAVLKWWDRFHDPGAGSLSKGPESAECARKSDGSQDLANHNGYHTLLHPSSALEPRDPTAGSCIIRVSSDAKCHRSKQKRDARGSRVSTEHARRRPSQDPARTKHIQLPEPMDGSQRRIAREMIFRRLANRNLVTTSPSSKSPYRGLMATKMSTPALQGSKLALENTSSVPKRLSPGLNQSWNKDAEPALCISSRATDPNNKNINLRMQWDFRQFRESTRKFAEAPSLYKLELRLCVLPYSPILKKLSWNISCNALRDFPVISWITNSRTKKA